MFYIFMLLRPVLHFYIDFPLLSQLDLNRGQQDIKEHPLCLSLDLWSVDTEELKILYGWEIERV